MAEDTARKEEEQAMQKEEWRGKMSAYKERHQTAVEDIDGKAAVVLGTCVTAVAISLRFCPLLQNASPCITHFASAMFRSFQACIPSTQPPGAARHFLKGDRWCHSTTLASADRADFLFYFAHLQLATFHDVCL